MRTFKELAAHLATSNRPINLKAIAIKHGSATIHGRGALYQEGGQLHCDIDSEGFSAPLPSGEVDESGMIQLVGILEHGPAFETTGFAGSNFWGSGMGTTRRTSFHVNRLKKIEVPETKPKTPEEAERMLASLLHNKKSTAPRMAVAATLRIPSFEIYGCDLATETVITNPFTNRTSIRITDTLMGRIGPTEYALIQREADCEISLRIPESGGIPEEMFRQYLRALLSAVAFIHGQHTWPMYQIISFTQWQDEESVNTPDAPARSIFRPVTRGSAREQCDVNGLIQAWVNFRLLSPTLSGQLGTFAFQAREAGSPNTPHDASFISLCATLEGMISMLHSTINQPANTKESLAFDALKAAIIATLPSMAPDDIESTTRFENIITSAGYYRITEKFDALVSFYNLPKDIMRNAYLSWKKQRNNRAHGTYKDYKSGELTDKSRIAGAINILAAACCGYKGQLCASMFEDAYIDIG